MQKITKKKIAVIAAVSLAAIAFFSMIRSCTKGSGDKFEYDEVTVGPVEKTISVTGVLEVTDVVNLLSKTTGVIDGVNVDFNQEVRKGQVLATIDSSTLDQQLNKTAAALESSRLEMIIAKEDLESKRSMFKDNLISEKGLERAEMNYKTVALKNRQILIDLNGLKEQKGMTRITAPINGIVIQKSVTKNAAVGINAPLFILAPSLKKMTLTIGIDETDIGLVAKGQKVKFTVSAFADKYFKGVIHQVRITPVLKGGLVTYESLVSCDNGDQLLKPGMTATATIEISRKERVLRVPNQALQVNPLPGKENEPDTVWKKSDKPASKVPVEKVKVVTGLKGDTHTEIKKNLKKGDAILVKFIRAGKGR